MGLRSSSKRDLRIKRNLGMNRAMKTASVMLGALLVVALAAPTSAKMGESLDASIKRYGLPSDGPTDSNHPDATSYAFVDSEWDISITYFEGRAEEIMVRKVDGSRFSRSEVLQWLRDLSDLPWSQKEAAEWRTSDGSTAGLSANHKAVHIWSPVWHRVVEEAEAKLQKEEQERFGGDKDAADNARQEEAKRSREAADRASEEINAKLRELKDLLGR
jgi:hypothetical protein